MHKWVLKALIIYIFIKAAILMPIAIATFVAQKFSNREKR